MRSPALAIAWELGRRHRWGLMAVTGYLLVLAALRLAGYAQRIQFDDDRAFALAVIVPLTSTFLYFLAVFTFGLGGDIAARQSIYPARMFTLPVTANALAGWPMLFGAVAAAVLWMATRSLAVWPADVDVPWLWPALFGPVLLAWTQALTWMPYPMRGMRVLVTVLWLTAIDAVVMIALEVKVSETVMLALLVPHLPLAYLVARASVARARRGDVPDWRIGRAKAKAPLPSFPTAARAQAWFEWRQHGRSLPALVAIVLPFVLAIAFLFPDTPVIVAEVLIGVLLLPPFLAIFVAATVSRHNSTFLSTRPMSSAALIASKLKVTLVSTLAAWVLVLIAVPVGFRLAGAWPLVAGGARRLAEVIGTPRAVALALLVLAALIASTWKQLVQSLYVGMSGREWLVKGSAFVALLVAAIALPLADWIVHNRAAFAALWGALPWILPLLAGVKLIAAAWIAMRLRQRLTERTLLLGAAAWCAAVLALYALLAWIAPDLVIRTHYLGLVAILLVPLARLSAAPLALDWNRYR